MDDEKNIDRNLEKILVDISLAEVEKNGTDNCPESEDIAALVDGRINDDKKRFLFSHIARCSDCYRQWLDLHTMVRETESQNILYASWQFIKIHKQSIFLAASFSSLAASLIIFIASNFVLNSIPKQLETSFQRIHKQNLSGKETVLPWEKSNTVFHMGPTSGLPVHLNDYASGLIAGKERIAMDSDQTSSRNPSKNQSILFWIGQWRVVLEAACLQSEFMNPKFIQAELKTCYLLKKALCKASSDQKYLKLTIRIISNVEEDLNRLLNEPENLSGCHRILKRFAPLDSQLVFQNN